MTIGYSKTYPLPHSGCYEKIWLEDEIATTDMEEVRKLQYALKKQVENFHFESNKAAEKQLEEQKIGIDVAIEACKSLTELESLKLLTRNDEKLTELYRKKLIQLT